MEHTSGVVSWIPTLLFPHKDQASNFLCLDCMYARVCLRVSMLGKGEKREDGGSKRKSIYLNACIAYVSLFYSPIQIMLLFSNQLAFASL